MVKKPTRLSPCCKDCGARMVPAFRSEVAAGRLVEAWACLGCAQAYVTPLKPAEFINFSIPSVNPVNGSRAWADDG